MKSIALAILSSTGELIGFKVDSFWTIRKTYPKIHKMNASNQIDTHLVPNLLYGLNKRESGVAESFCNGTELFIAAYECPKEGPNWEYPVDELAKWHDNLPQPTLLYKLRRTSYWLNGVDKPWVAEIDF